MNIHNEEIKEESYKYENDSIVKVFFGGFFGALLGALIGATCGAVSLYNIGKLFPQKNLLLGTDDNSSIMGLFGCFYFGFFGLIIGGVVSVFKISLSKSMIIGFIVGALTGVIFPGGVFILSIFVMGLTGITVSILTDLYYGKSPKINLE